MFTKLIGLYLHLFVANALKTSQGLLLCFRRAQNEEGILYLERSSNIFQTCCFLLCVFYWL
jgi:hypothetical protein